jgi:hypothetical protein
MLSLSTAACRFRSCGQSQLSERAAGVGSAFSAGSRHFSAKSTSSGAEANFPSFEFPGLKPGLK